VPVLAELEVFHSRPIAPTRRVALGEANLPVDPAPGFGGILLGAIVAGHIGRIDPDLHPDLMRLTVQLEDGRTIPQPRLRFRYQTDRVGLLRSRFALVDRGEELAFDFSDRCLPAQAVLGAVYAAGRLELPTRHVVMSTIRRAMSWSGPLGPDLVAALTGVGHGAFSLSAFEDPKGWALRTLGFDVDDLVTPVNGNGGGRPAPTSPSRREVLRRFREQLREAHPDHGGQPGDAASRIADLTEARRILLRR
jgi:hypothetical protein